MQSAEKVSITLMPDMLREVREAVQKGEFASTSEALRDAVRRSRDDPRPDLDEEAVERHFANLHAETVKAHRGAKA